MSAQHPRKVKATRAEFNAARWTFIFLVTGIGFFIYQLIPWVGCVYVAADEYTLGEGAREFTATSDHEEYRTQRQEIAQRAASSGSYLAALQFGMSECWKTEGFGYGQKEGYEFAWMGCFGAFILLRIYTRIHRPRWKKRLRQTTEEAERALAGGRRRYSKPVVVVDAIEIDDEIDFGPDRLSERLQDASGGRPKAPTGGPPRVPTASPPLVQSSDFDLEAPPAEQFSSGRHQFWSHDPADESATSRSSSEVDPLGMMPGAQPLDPWEPPTDPGDSHDLGAPARARSPEPTAAERPSTKLPATQPSDTGPIAIGGSKESKHGADISALVRAHQSVADVLDAIEVFVDVVTDDHRTAALWGGKAKPLSALSKSRVSRQTQWQLVPLTVRFHEVVAACKAHGVNPDDLECLIIRCKYSESYTKHRITLT
jgi:hypothetical protein